MPDLHATRSARPGRARSGDQSWIALPAVVALLCGIGVMMVLSASSVQALRSYGGPWVFFFRQLLWVTAGGTALYLAAKVDYRWWRKAALPLLGACTFLLFLVLIPGIGVNAGGSSRWLGAGQFRFQPSEVTKLALLLFAAEVVVRRTERHGLQAVVVRPVLLATGLIGLLVML